MRRLFLLALASVGCLPALDDLSVPSEAGLPEAELALSPEPLVDLVEDPRAVLSLPDSCGMEDGLEAPEEDPVVWSADCLLSDGSTLDGVLSWTRSEEGAVLLGDRFVLRQDGRIAFELDGMVELQEQGDLLLLTVAAGWCGPGGPSCEDRPATLDLAYTLFPVTDYPDAYSVTVEGAVGSDDAVMAVEGMWAIDDAVCSDEPVRGVLSLRGVRGHALELDGADHCDGCGTWAMADDDDPRWCMARF